MVIVEVLPAENKLNELKQGNSDLPLQDEDENLEPPAKQAKKLMYSFIFIALIF